MSTTPVVDDDGNVSEALAMVTDITERKQTEEALRQSEQRLTTVLESSPVGVAIVSNKTEKRLYVNPTFHELFGFDRSEDVTNANVTESYANPEDRVQIHKIFQRDGAVTNFEVQRLRANGEKWWCLLNAREITYGGEMSRVSWMVDITQRKKAEAELHNLNEELEQRVASLNDTVREYAGKYKSASQEFEDARARMRRELGKEAERDRRTVLAEVLDAVGGRRQLSLELEQAEGAIGQAGQRLEQQLQQRLQRAVERELSQLSVAELLYDQRSWEAGLDPDQGLMLG